jgi:hypothetical protein
VGLFGGCDDASDFAFQTESSALAAAQALLDQVLINNSLGSFDDNTTLTFGCSDPTQCNSVVPFAVLDQNRVAIRIAANFVTESADRILFGAVDRSNFFDTRESTFANYALFTVSAAVPEPATWAMMIGGFGMLGAAARRRARSSVTYA